MKIVLWAMFAAVTFTLEATEIDKEFSLFAKAINRVEAHGKHHNVRPGDDGKAIGPLQIHWSYWHDAVQSEPSLGGVYTDCKQWNYSVRVMKACLTRYAPKAMADRDWQTLARIHNGGPMGATEKSTKNYWLKVHQAMGGVSGQN